MIKDTFENIAPIIHIRQIRQVDTKAHVFLQVTLHEQQDSGGLEEMETKFLVNSHPII